MSPVGGDKSLFQRWLGCRFPNLWKTQTFRSCKSPPRTRYGVREGDETLKGRVATKFDEGDVSGGVRELASAEGLAHQDGDTLE